MEDDDREDDVRAIEALIARQFASLSWGTATSADWQGFAADFLPDASLYPAARPARRQTVEAFADRMQILAQTTLRSFEERVLGTEVRVFGNVAVALAACEMTENETEVNRAVEALLLVKTGGAWRIVAQAWDREREDQPIPAALGGSGPASTG